eukprot:SAG31_NODE_6340_length_2057_cov_2.141982_2_plen_115_part_00
MPHQTRVNLNQELGTQLTDDASRRVAIDSMKRAYAVLTTVAIVAGSVSQRLLTPSVGRTQEKISAFASYAVFIIGAILEVQQETKGVKDQLSSLLIGLICIIFNAGIIEATLGL